MTSRVSDSFPHASSSPPPHTHLLHARNHTLAWSEVVSAVAGMEARVIKAACHLQKTCAITSKPPHGNYPASLYRG